MSPSIQEAKNHMETPSFWAPENYFWRNLRLLGLWGGEKKAGSSDL